MILTVILIIAIIGCAIGFYFYKKNNKPQPKPEPSPKPEPAPDPEPIVDSVKWKNTNNVHVPCQGKILENVELEVTGNPLIKFEAKIDGVINDKITFDPSEGTGITKTSISVDSISSDESRIIEIIVKKDGE